MTEQQQPSTSQTSENPTVGGTSTRNNSQIIVPNNQQFFQIIQNHLKIHQDALKPNDPLADEDYAKYPDASCQACHPLEEAVNNLSPKFKNFWIDWFTPIR